MALTEYDSELDIDPMFATTHREVWQRLGECGTWWTGTERVAAMSEARAAFECQLCSERSDALSPSMIEGTHDSVSELPGQAVELVHKLTTDPGRLTQEWANATIDALGEERYVELAIIVCTQYVIESFAKCLGLALLELPTPGEGAPSQVRPTDVGDVGAWVSQTLDKALANVSRAGSLVPDTEVLWRDIVQCHYSRGSEFAELVWNRALSRPQTELVASTVSALNECFY